ncbi:hypothetical protein ACFX1T_007674 [Malus domestica]
MDARVSSIETTLADLPPSSPLRLTQRLIPKSILTLMLVCLFILSNFFVSSVVNTLALVPLLPPTTEHGSPAASAKSFCE